MNAVDACPDPEVIQRFALGRLSEEQSLPLEQHLARCPACSRRLQSTDARGDQLLQAIRDRPDHLAVSPEAVAALLPVLQALRPPDDTLPPRGVDDTTRSVESGRVNEGEPAGLPLGFLEPPAVPGEMGVLGGYRVKRILGAGGMGVVLLAEDSRLHRPMAIKVIQPHLASRAEVRQRFLREARAVAAIEHDNIVAVHRVDEQHGMLYLAMPLLRGESLETRLDRLKAPLPLADVLQIGRETAAGLAAAHARSILHRDIKPGNLWLEERAEGAFRVKLLDFGLARRPGMEESELSQVGSIVGTPAYMAPEQARGEEIDARADLFSLGCLLYRTATGRPPFSGRDALSVIISIATDAPAPLTGVPPDVARLIMRLLAKRPDERPASARAVVEETEALERKHFGPHMTRRRWLIAAGLGGAGLAGGVTWWLAAPPPPKPALPGKLSLALDESDKKIIVAPDEGKPRTVDLAKEATLELPAGSYSLKPARKGETRTLMPRRLLVKAGESRKVALRLVGEIRKQAEHTQTIWCVAISPVKNSLMALSASGDHTVAYWNAAKDDNPKFLIGHKSPVRCVAFSADGTLAVSGSGARGRKADCSVRVWDLKKAALLETPVTLDNWILCVAFSPKEPAIAWGSADGSAGLWDRKTNKKRCDLTGHSNSGVNAIVFSPDGKRVLTGGSDGLVMLWDATDGKRLRIMWGQTKEIHGVAFAPGGKQVASASEDGIIHVWDLARRDAVAIKGHKGAVYAIAWTPDGRQLVSGGADGTVRVWSVANKSEVESLKGHKGTVRSVACATDGRRALSGGGDRTVRLWELPA